MATRQHLLNHLLNHRYLGNAVLLLLSVWAMASEAAELTVIKPEKAGVSSERLQRLVTLADAYVDSGKLAGMVLMVNRGGKMVYSKATGTRSVDDVQPLKKDDLFRIYSMTKPITAVAAMQLYEAGHFHLSDPITKWLPELADLKVMQADGSLVATKTPITMHHLLTHTAGFSYGFDPRDAVDQAYRAAGLWGAEDLSEFAEKIATLPLKYHPGEQWHYSIAVDLTGLIIERMSGLSFDEYLHKNIFEPLAMTDTFFQVPVDKLDRFLANHYWDRSSKQLKVIGSTVPGLGIDSSDDAMSNYHAVSLYSGGGGLVSTARDYMRFAEMLRAGGSLDGHRILGAKTLKFMTQNHLPATISASGSGENPLNNRFRGFGFGLGFGIILDPVSNQAIASRGAYMWGGAAGTIFWVDPEEDIVALAMIQLMGSPWALREDFRVAVYQALIESYE